MAETIESFVAKLQEEGVQAGEAQAATLREEARKHAEKTIAEAKQQAEKILQDARKEADATLDRSRTELNLAARDTVLKLRDALSRALQAVIRQGSEQALDDLSFLGQVLHEVVESYAKSDREGTDQIRISVKPELRDKLVDWALSEIGKERVENTRKRIGIDLKGTLHQAGFEYTCAGATVEVTLDSVVELLSQMVSPRLREVLDNAVSEETPKE
jgi:V/A-type H+/Na+-transporting ATPase subunit E